MSISITTTCGHQVQSVDELFDLQIKGHDKTGSPCIVYGCYCKECAEQHEHNGTIISSKKDENEWLNSDPIVEDSTLYQDALLFSSHSASPQLAEFAKRVCRYIESNIPPRTSPICIKIDTDNAFTLSLNEDVNITGVGKVEYQTIEDAILALNGAKITWVRPIKAHTPDGLYYVNETDTDHCSFFIQYCHSAALSLLDNGLPYSKIDGPYSLSVQ